MSTQTDTHSTPGSGRDGGQVGDPKAGGFDELGKDEKAPPKDDPSS